MSLPKTTAADADRENCPSFTVVLHLALRRDQTRASNSHLSPKSPGFDEKKYTQNTLISLSLIKTKRRFGDSVSWAFRLHHRPRWRRTTAGLPPTVLVTTQGPTQAIQPTGTGRMASREQKHQMARIAFSLPHPAPACPALSQEPGRRTNSRPAGAGRGIDRDNEAHEQAAAS